jgi:hypothetical protein
MNSCKLVSATGFVLNADVRIRRNMLGVSWLSKP